jgi:hypothetical protein
MPTIKKRPIEAEDLYAMQLISEMRLSPDGRTSSSPCSA